MQKFNVTGMSCAACSARIEKTVSAVPGVSSCSVSLLTNSMSVEGTADPSAVISAVKASGYGASLAGKARKADDALEDRETPLMVRRLVLSVIFLIVLMYFSMGHMMFKLPLPPFFDGNHIAVGLAQLLLTIAIMIINNRFFVNGFKGLIHRAPNMDTLVSLGAGAAFIYSLYNLFAMTGVEGHAAAAYMNEFYFESAGTILTLITVGKTLEARSKGKTTNALKGLMSLAPKTAVLLRDGAEVTVPVEEVKKGDIFLVRPAGNIPVDGVVIEGNSAVNEAALTGESIPVDKAPGDAVSAGTINQSGFLKCEAVKVGEDTTLSQIIRMVSDASATKAPIARIADVVSGVFVPTVIAIAVIAAAVWLMVGQSFGFALARGISVLVISCPCALGLATPVAIMVGNGVGAKNGILFKTAASLEQTGKVTAVVMDKTGTITRGEPEVTDIIPIDISEDELLSVAAAVENRSEHPLAKAVMKKAADCGIEVKQTENFTALAGSGVTAALDEKIIFGGSMKFISEKINIPEKIVQLGENLAEEGKTPLLFMANDKLAGIIAVADVIKEDSPQAVRELRNMGIRVIMLTGDNQRTAEAVGKLAGVDEVIAEVMPDGKENVIRRLKLSERVAMVGDGINDAPALTRADTGIAVGAGTDIAIDAADVVLMKSRLTDVPAAIRLSRKTLRNIHENLFWAFIYNIAGIPLAAGAFIHLTGLEMDPMFGALAMSLSSFCVVSNALRLNLFNIHDSRRDKKIKSKKERVTMTKTISIEGMMCAHCEASVKKALEALAGVETAEVSHEEGTAVVSLSGEVADDVLKKAVEDKDYKVLSVE